MLQVWPNSINCLASYTVRFEETEWLESRKPFKTINFQPLLVAFRKVNPFNKRLLTIYNREELSCIYASWHITSDISLKQI